MREHYALLNRMRRALGIALVAVPVLAHAQVSLYSFSESLGTYTEITAADGGVSLGVPEYWPHVFNNRAWVNNPFNDPGGQVTQSGYLNAAMGPGYPIGFDFSFNGDVFDVIGISNGGWISFGKSSDLLSAVWVYNWSGTSNGDPFTQWFSNDNAPLSPAYKRNRVAGFGNSSLQMVDWTSLAPPGQLSNLRMATIGTAPNRVCVIQWKDFGLRNDVTVSMNRINFQIRLNESDNSVEVVYGSMDWVSALGRYVPTQIGLSGRSNEDFNGRMTVAEEPAFTHDWNNTRRATSNIASESSCVFAVPALGQPPGSGTPPTEGLTWRWEAPVCPPPAWPLAISSISFASAVATWIPLEEGEYEYLVTETNDVNAPAVVSGFTSDPEIIMDGLQPLTMHYLFLRRICDGEPGPWSMATRFRTKAGGVIACDGTAQFETYCSHQNDTIQWIYVSEDGSPLKIEFLGGYVGNTSGGSFHIWDGPAPVGTPGLSVTRGSVTGLSFTASAANGGAMFMQLITDNGACEAQDWYLPFEWRIGCRNCSDPLVNFSVVEDCDNEQYSVELDIFSLGTSSSVRLDNDRGVAPTTVSATGIHTVGPFAAGTAVVVTVQNPGEAMCYTSSPVLLNQPCALVDCGPTTYTYCYGDNEWMQRAFQGEGDQEIGIRFLSGAVGFGDDLNVYNGLDVSGSSTPVNTLMNTLITSGAPSTDRALVLELISDASHSCADEDPLYGTSAPWEYVVACYDGCIQPRATFAAVCVDQTHFNVEVTITEIGNTNVSITNNRGVAPTTATAAGTYTVGPFASGTPVRLELVGASVLCTWASNPLDRNCVGIGIEEVSLHTMALFPNPNDGRFTLELPEAMSGAGELQVLDLAGRMVAQQRLSGTAIQQVDLTALPNGLYTLLLRNNGRTFNGKISIQR